LSGEVKDYVRGLYGKPPAPIDAEVQKKIIGEEEVVTVRPADLLAPGWEKLGRKWLISRIMKKIFYPMPCSRKWH
jgi:oxaloacetate decarboxylase alpha subunit